MPLFPLPSVAILPHAILPLHIFELRYRQLVGEALNGSGQLALAVIDTDIEKEPGSPPALKPIVCVGQIVQHERLPDGRYNILLQGVCRARIFREEPAEGDRLYRRAILRPVESGEASEEDLDEVRLRLHHLLTESPLRRLASAENVAACLARVEAPTAAILELVGISILCDNEVRYQLLSEGDPVSRAEIIERELKILETLLSRAEKQFDPTTPKGVAWN